MFRKVNDTLNLLSKLNFKKLRNLALVYSSFFLSRATKEFPFKHGLPYAISIEPTTSCNLRCPECPSGLRAFTRKTGMLNLSDFQSYIDQIQNHLIYLTLYFQGEPYLNPSFYEMVRYASNKNIYTATSTNAHYLNEDNAKKTIQAGLDRMIISIDGLTQGTYQDYRVGGKLEKVIEGAKNMVYWKQRLGQAKPYLIFQFLVTRSNEHQIDELKQLASCIGIDEVKLKTIQVYDYVHGNDLIPLTEKYSRYRRGKDGKYYLKNKLDNHCWKMWHSAVVTWDGKVVPCCFDKDADHSMGNLGVEDFNKIWNGHKYYAFRKQLMKSRRNIDICRNCSEGTKVWT